MKEAGFMSLLVKGWLEANSVSSVRAYYRFPVTTHLLSTYIHTHKYGIDTMVWKEEEDGKRSVIVHTDPRSYDPNHADLFRENVTLSPIERMGIMCTYNNTSTERIRVS